MMAKAIMIQGTMSNVGKSLITAGLCRIFRQDGYRVAPFKSQNMALNSYITADGLEMGRAQVVQAQAAGIMPDVRMNPILLKPTSDKGSQVIINGEVIGDMSAKDYFSKKRSYIPKIMESYESLSRDYDILVLEGAGSPAEINLKQDDIVNMGMAKLAHAPVLLVGDIDRGGVFASLAGTLMLLDPDEKDIIKGLIINKFRGDVNILKPGLTMIEEITNKQVLGVVPYLHVDIDDEDSLSDRLTGAGKGGAVDIAVIRLPRISNFTDFNVFQVMPEVNLRYVSALSELGNPDLILLPGTKSTISDLLWLRQSGLEGGILKLAGHGTPVIGICGGYQMLGKSISDPEGAEGQKGQAVRGLGLLPIETQFIPQKTRRQVKGKFAALSGIFSCLSGIPLEGYEIHMGVSSGVEASPAVYLEERRPDGIQSGNVLGTYVHGLFDADGVAQKLIAALMEKKGLSPLEGEVFQLAKYREKQYDLLADGVRQALDMKHIYEILDSGI